MNLIRSRRSSRRRRTQTREPFRLTLLALLIAILVVAAGVLTSNSASAQPPISDIHASRALLSQNLQPSWLHEPPVLAGKVVHWTQYSYASARGSTVDPAIGQVIMGDVWEEFGVHNEPTLYHAWYTFADGTLQTEVFETPNISITVYGQGYFQVLHAKSPTSPQSMPQWCVTHWHASAEALLMRAVPFADEHALQTAGFAMVNSSSSPAHTLPTTPALAQTNEAVSFPSPATVHTWSMDGRVGAAGHMQKTTFNLDQSSRVVFERSQVFDGTTSVLSDFWLAYGDLRAYASHSGIPATVFAMPRQLTEGCN